MSGDGPVSSLGLEGLPVGGHKHAGHQAQRAETLSHNVRLDVAIIVLAGPDKSSAALQGLTQIITMGASKRVYSRKMMMTRFTGLETQ